MKIQWLRWLRWGSAAAAVTAAAGVGVGVGGDAFAIDERKWLHTDIQLYKRMYAHRGKCILEYMVQ